jgi:hypothetical protein
MNDHTALLQLLEARSLKDAKRIVSTLVDRGFVWLPLGAKEGNFGLVNIGSDPGFAFIERITNALDAVIDEAARHAAPAVVAQLRSPRAAVAALFAIPEGRAIHLAPERGERLARDVVVTIGDGTVHARPLLEVRDNGTGLTPDAMPATILNLARRRLRFPPMERSWRRHRTIPRSASPSFDIANSMRARTRTGATSIFAGPVAPVWGTFRVLR